MRTKIGGVTLAWCCCLFVTTGILFWVPFCCDSCKDTEVVCQGCQLVKTTIPANCCWLIKDLYSKRLYRYLLEQRAVMKNEFHNQTIMNGKAFKIILLLVWWGSCRTHRRKQVHPCPSQPGRSFLGVLLMRFFPLIRWQLFSDSSLKGSLSSHHRREGTPSQLIRDC